MEVTVNRKHLKHLGSALLAASLLVGTVASTASAASSTRIVSIGSTTDCAAAVVTNGAPGTLDTLGQSPTVGGLIRVDVSVENCGGQNLSNASVTLGGQPAGDAQPASPFADGSVIDSVENGSGCTGVGTARLTCTYKSLRPSAPVSFRAYVKAGSASSLGIYAAVLFNEGTNTTGSNPQSFLASEAVTVGASTCDSFSTYLSLSKRTAALCGLSDPANANKQSTAVKLLSSTLTSAAVSETSTGPTCVAPNGVACLGDYSVASVPTVPGDVLEWTMTVDLGAINVNTKKVIVYHWYSDPTFQGGFVELDNTSAFSCKSRSAADGCIVSVTKSGTVLTVIFRTPANGSSRILG
jgi:hypothetical protein